ncbi:ATP-binding protein [Glycomyces halotolerans]
MRLALLPMTGAALLGAGVAVFVSRIDIGGQSAWMPTVVIGSAAVFLAVIGYLAFHTATRIETDLGRRVTAVRRSTMETHYRIWQALDEVQRRLPPEQRRPIPLPNQAHQPVTTDEALRVLAAEAQLLRQVADDLAGRGLPVQVQGPQGGHGREPQPTSPIETASAHSRVGIFVNLARRLQSLVHREIEQLDELENQVEDPDLLKGLFSVDHLATRIRRHAENLAVLGGATSHRQWSRPVNVYEALRSAVAEVEQYARVKLVRPIDGNLKGHAVADIIHLVAELVENATAFSAPQTQVLIRVQRVRAGLAVEVEDRGLGMEAEERERYNKMLAAPDEIDLDELLADGRIGLYVVACLAGRHELTVQLQSNIFGGTQAIVVIGDVLLGDSPNSAAPKEAPAPPRQHESQAMPVRQPSEPPRSPSLPSVQLQTGPGESGRHHRSQPAVGNGQTTTEAPRLSPGYSAAPVYSPAHTGAGGYHTAEIPAVDTQSAGGPGQMNGGAAERPALPKRNKQSHLAPQLRDTPPPPTGRGSEAGHDPGLMKAFQQGRGRADEHDDAPPIPNSDSFVTPYRDEEA